MSEVVVARRLALLRLAESLGDITEACKRMAVARRSYYTFAKRYKEHGLEGLRDMPPLAKSHPMAANAAEIELIREFALRHPAMGCDRLHALLVAGGHSTSSSSAIQKYLTRLGLATQRARWLTLEAEANTLVLSTEQAAFVTKHNPFFRERYRLPASCGVVLSQDVRLLGRFKVLGPIYLHSVVDHYSGYAFGLIYAAKRPEAAITLLHNTVLPYYERLGIKPRLIQTHGGREFSGGRAHPYMIYLALNGIEHLAIGIDSERGAGLCERLSSEARAQYLSLCVESDEALTFARLQKQMADWLKDFNDSIVFDGFPNFGSAPAARMPTHDM